MPKVIVVGDAGLDVYHVGKVRGVSAEAPIPVLDQTSEITLPGMGMNIFTNLLALDVEVSAGFTTHFPQKHRLMTEDGQQIARWDIEDYCNPYEELVIPASVDAIVIAGYGKGSLPKPVVDALVATGLPMFIDTKSTPLPWLEAADRSVLFPNELEYQTYSEEYSEFPTVMLKCGASGVKTLYYGAVSASFPSMAKYARCVNGAGDTFLAGLVAGLDVDGLDPHFPIKFGLAAAANVVEQPFSNRTTTWEAVMSRLEHSNIKRPSGRQLLIEAPLAEADWGPTTAIEVDFTASPDA